MFSLPYVQCNIGDTNWKYLVIISIASFFIYVIGTPVLMIYLLRKYKSISHQIDTKVWLGSLYLAYNDGAYYYELVVLLRRLLISASLAFIPSSFIAKPMIVNTLLVLSVSLHLMYVLKHY